MSYSVWYKLIWNVFHTWKLKWNSWCLVNLFDFLQKVAHVKGLWSSIVVLQLIKIFINKLGKMTSELPWSTQQHKEMCPHSSSFFIIILPSSSTSWSDVSWKLLSSLKIQKPEQGHDISFARLMWCTERKIPCLPKKEETFFSTLALPVCELHFGVYDAQDQSSNWRVKKIKLRIKEGYGFERF